MAATAPQYSPRLCIPTEPVLDRIYEWIERHHYMVTDNGEMRGGRDTLEDLLGLNVTRLGRQSMMTFDAADRILSKLGCFLDWYTHPVLAPIYAGLNLRPTENDLRLLGDESALKAMLSKRESSTRRKRESRERRAHMDEFEIEQLEAAEAAAA